MYICLTWNLRTTNKSVGAVTGLAPNEVRVNRLPRVIEHQYARRHQSLDRDQFEYCDSAADRQRRSHEMVANNTSYPLHGLNG